MSIDKAARAEWRAYWPIPLVGAIGYGTAVTHIYAIGLFIKPLEEQFGWDRSAITWALTVASIVAMIFGPMTGAMVDKFGPRRIAIPGVTLYCAAFAAVSLTGESVWTWWALWMFVGLGGASIQAAVWTAAVASRFNRSRGLALAVALCGGGLSSTLIPILTQYYIAQVGWRGAFLAIGATLALIGLPLVIFFFFGAREARVPAGEVRSIAPLRGASYREAAFSGHYLRLVLIAMIIVTAMMALVVHYVPILEGKGISRVSAAGAAGMIGIGSIVGRLAGGFLLDRSRGPSVAAAIFAVPMIVSMLLLWTDVTPAIAMVGALLLGIAVGGEVDVIAYLTSRYFGLKCFGALFATLCIFQSFGLAVGPFIGGLVYDRLGGYDPLLLATIPAFALAALLALTLPRYPVEAPDVADDAALAPAGS